MDTLVTERILLRRLTADDAPALHRTTGDPEVMRYWFPGPDHEVAETRRRIRDIEDHWLAHGFGDWAVATRSGSRAPGADAHGTLRHGHVIGFAGLHHIADMQEVNLGYALERSRWGGGLGTETAAVVLAHGFETLELDRIVAVIDPRNSRSIALVARCGMVLCDEVVWQGRRRLVYAVTHDEWAVEPGGTRR